MMFHDLKSSRLTPCYLMFHDLTKPSDYSHFAAHSHASRISYNIPHIINSSPTTSPALSASSLATVSSSSTILPSLSLSSVALSSPAAFTSRMDVSSG